VASITVGALADAFGSRPSDLIAVVGPSIGPCCYEVGAEVRGRFLSNGFEPADMAGWFFEERRQSAANPSLGSLGDGPRPGHCFLDVAAVARDQLVAAGIPAQQVSGAALCTASHAGTFCSYRRDGRSAGRMAAAIRARGAVQRLSC
jgi:copper oxidase (laccase) domain-containing protein